MTGPIIRAIERSRDTALPDDDDPPVFTDTAEPSDSPHAPFAGDTDAPAPLKLNGDVHPLPPMPTLPSAAELHRAAAAAGRRAGKGVPHGVPAGPTDAADVLDWLSGALAGIRRTLADKAAGGFLVTAADMQRHAEVSRIFGTACDEIGRILAERA